MKNLGTAFIGDNLPALKAAFSGRAERLVLPVSAVKTYNRYRNEIVEFFREVMADGGEVFLEADELYSDKALNETLREAEYWAAAGITGFIVSSLGLLKAVYQQAGSIKLIAGECLGPLEKNGVLFLKEELGVSGIMLQPDFNPDTINLLYKASGLELWFPMIGKNCRFYRGSCFLPEYFNGRKKENLPNCLPGKGVSIDFNGGLEIRHGNYLLDKLGTDDAAYIPFPCHNRLVKTGTGETDYYLCKPGTRSFMQELPGLPEDVPVVLLVDGRGRDMRFARQVPEIVHKAAVFAQNSAAARQDIKTLEEKMEALSAYEYLRTGLQ